MAASFAKLPGDAAALHAMLTPCPTGLRLRSARMSFARAGDSCRARSKVSEVRDDVCSRAPSACRQRKQILTRRLILHLSSSS